MNKENALVKLESAGVLKGDKWLIRDIDLSVCPGEIVTLIGPNGSGKSTTVKTALGLIRPNEGRASRKRGLTIGYVPQKLSIDETLPLTVARLMRLTHSHNAEAIHEALAAVNALDLMNRRVQALSGGEFQRVLLARAIAGKPDLLVLDEPAQGVDFANEAALYDLIVKYRDDTGSGILLISHDLHIVMAQTDKVLCLNGHVCCTGTPQNVISSPKYKELFGERAAQSLAIYQHQHDHKHLEDGRVLHADGTITDHCYEEDGHHHHHDSYEGGTHAG